MKTGNSEHVVIRDNIASETSFTIKATGKAFKILSDGLYTDKILAIVRELSCNAYDAHVAAGNPEVPFRVTLPSAIDPSFKIRDFGTGLSHENVMHLYTSYFESTKTDSNDFIGALGLGSKSPFSYVDSFIVNSYFNGTKRMYTAFIAEYGVPSITLLGDEQTDEPNGLEVVVPVAKRDDFDTFRIKAEQVYQYFKVVPEIIGNSKFKIPERRILLSGENWELVDRNYYDSRPMAIQGNVAYPIDANAFTGRAAHSWTDILNMALRIYLPIGHLEVAASREALSMDPRTQQNIIEVLKAIKKDILRTIEETIEKEPTVWAARVRLNKISSMTGYVRQLLVNNPIQYKGARLPEYVIVKLKDFPQVTGLSWQSYYSSRPRHRYRYNEAIVERDWSKRHHTEIHPNEFSVQPDESQTIWIDDVGHTMRSRLMSQKLSNHIHAFSFDLPDTVSSRKPDQIRAYLDGLPAVKQFIAALQGAPVRYVSEIDKPQPVASYRRSGKFFAFSSQYMLTKDYYADGTAPLSVKQKGLHSGISEGWSEVELEDGLAGQVWMEVFKFLPVKYKDNYSTFGKIVAYAEHLGILTTPIYGVREKDLKLTEPEFEFTEWLKTKCMALLKEKKILEKVQARAEWRRVRDTVGQQKADFLVGYLNAADLPDGILKRTILAYKSHTVEELTKQEQQIYDLCGMLNLDLHVNSQTKPVADNIIQLYQQVIKRYPLMDTFVRYNEVSWRNKVSKSEVQEYVKTVDTAYPEAVA